MTAMEKPLESAPEYTARNAKRSPAYGAAAKYLDPAQERNLEHRLRETLRRANALRVATRITNENRRRDRSNPLEEGLSRIRFTLHGIRDAESVEALINRDRLLDGIIIGARLFGSLPADQIAVLQALRENAFDYRRKELMRRYDLVES